MGRREICVTHAAHCIVSRRQPSHIVPIGLRGPSDCSGLDRSDPPCDPKANCLEGAGLDPAKQEVKKAMQSGDPEAVALLVNRQAKVAAKDVSLLLDLLPSENLRWSGLSQPTAKSFQAGSFVHGGVRGIRSSARKFPESTNICANVRQLFPTLCWAVPGCLRDSPPVHPNLAV